MEIRDYIAVARRRLWMVIVVPVVAAAVAVALAADHPGEYEATATVVVRPSVSLNPTPQIVNQAVEDFRGVMSSAALLDRVSLETGISRNDIRSGLATLRQRASLVVEVSYVGDVAEAAREVVDAAARTGLEILAQSDVARAEAQYAEALALFTEADAQLQAMLEEAQLGAPADEYRALISKIRESELRLAERQIEGDAGAIQRIQAELDADRAAANALRSIISRYDTLALLRNQNAQVLESALGARQVARATNAAIEDALVVEPTTVFRQSPVPTLVERAIVVAAIAFILAVAFVVILESLGPSRLPGAPPSSEDESPDSHLSESPF